VDSRVNNGTLKRIEHSDISTKTSFKRKQKSKRLSAPLHNLRQLMPTLVKTLTPSPIQEECLNNDKESIQDLRSSKDKDASEEHFIRNIVGRNVNGVEQV